MARKNTQTEFAVIGLGRFGASLAHALVQRGYTVLAIDQNKELVQSLADELTQVVALDATDEDALRAVDIASFDVVVVAISSSLENNLMATLALKTLGVKRIICKALTQKQRVALLAIGADEVVLPEEDSARRLAAVLTTPWYVDQIPLGDNFRISEFHTPPRFVGRTLDELSLRRSYSVTVVAVEHHGEMIISPAAEYRLGADDTLAVLGSNENLDRLARAF